MENCTITSTNWSRLLKVSLRHPGLSADSELSDYRLLEAKGYVFLFAFCTWKSFWWFSLSVYLLLKVRSLCSPDVHLFVCSSVCRLKRVLLLLVKFIKHKQIYYLKLDVSTSIRGLHQKKLVLSSSGSWRDGKTPCQESGRMRGSVGSCPHHGSCCPSFRMCMASLIHLVKRSGSLSITVAWDQLSTEYWTEYQLLLIKASDRGRNIKF